MRKITNFWIYTARDHFQTFFVASFWDSTYDNNQENLHNKVKGKFSPIPLHSVAEVLSSPEELRVISFSIALFIEIPTLF